MDYNMFISAVVTLASAFLGAWSAFKLEDRARKRKKQEDNIAAGNRAIFMLTRMFNELGNIQQQVIDPVRKREAKSITMLPLLTQNYDDLRFEVNNLTFLLETEYRQILMQLLIEESRFHAAIQLLNERSKLHLREVQPLLKRAGIVEGVEYSKEQIEAALGPYTFPQILRSTEQVISHIDQTVDSLLEMGERLNGALKSLFPDSKFIRFKPTNKSATPKLRAGQSGGRPGEI
ncbi:MAG: hypothetical protein HY204_00845 [Nitrospirae bacterium]|nr:hypothetical protein [Nitrospirota bacterium]